MSLVQQIAGRRIDEDGLSRQSHTVRLVDLAGFGGSTSISESSFSAAARASIKSTAKSVIARDGASMLLCEQEELRVQKCEI